jgi:glycosidase
MFRSSIRIIAVTPDGRTTNDILVKLQYGKVLDNIADLTRKDKQAFILYSLMIDRFNNGNKANDKPLNQLDVLPTVDYHGGDFKGITEKIKSGFFSNLGINTIWISPIAQNVEGAWGLDKDPFTRFSAYHGYWPVNPTVIDYHFGTDTELREMLDEAHKRNLNVILDYVANHLHQESPILKQHPDWNTPMHLPDGRPNIRLFDEQRLTTWFDTFLPTLDLERDDVCEAMTDSALYWLQTYDFDGFRHDAAKHIPEKYWRMLTKKIKQRIDNPDIFQIGETYGKPQLLRSYVKSGMLDSQFDFGIYHSAVNTFGTPDNTMKDLFKDLTRSLNSYGYHNLMGNISGNHDKPRFISVAGGTVSLKENTKAAGRKRKIEVGDTVAYRKLALLESFMFTIPGIPCIYQGDEYGVPGANDPDNRRMMQFDGYDHNESRLLETVKKLTKIRSSSLPLIYGDLIPLYCDDDLFAFVRVYMGNKVIVAFNHSAESKELNIQLPFNASFSNLKTNFGQIIESNDETLTMLLEPYAFEILTE